MKIGIFDSGLGGLVIAKALFRKLPQYDYVFLGDTKNVPYGDKSVPEVYRYTKNAVDFLCRKKCSIIIIACNTASALALRKIQQEYLPEKYPGKKVLGVIIPTVEEVRKKYAGKTTAIISTKATAQSHIYKIELQKLHATAKIYELATPKLVPLIEENSLQKAEKALQLYVRTLQKHKIEALILGCTHYPILKSYIKMAVGTNVRLISQDTIIPKSLKNYLKRHSEIETKLSKKSLRTFFVTKRNKNFQMVANNLLDKKIPLRTVTTSPA